jgi:hypothetical protein
MMFTETTQIWGKEFPGSMFHDAWELLFFRFFKESAQLNLPLISALPHVQLQVTKIASNYLQSCAPNACCQPHNFSCKAIVE